MRHSRYQRICFLCHTSISLMFSNSTLVICILKRCLLALLWLHCKVQSSIFQKKLLFLFACYIGRKRGSAEVIALATICIRCSALSHLSNFQFILLVPFWRSYILFSQELANAKRKSRLCGAGALHLKNLQAERLRYVSWNNESMYVPEALSEPSLERRRLPL